MKIPIDIPMLYSDRYQLEKSFEKYLKNNPIIKNCQQNFLAWLPSTEKGREVILRMAHQINNLPIYKERSPDADSEL